MPSASTIKVLISVALWEAVAAGALDSSARVPASEMTLGDPDALVPGFDPATEFALSDLDLLMLSVSDNDATNAIIDRVGMDAVNAVGARLGLTHTVLRRHMLDLAAVKDGRDNTTSAADLAALMAALGAAAGIAPEIAERVLHGLGRSQHRDIIPRYLPLSVTSVACKQGDIAAVRHDAALISDGARLTALAVMSRPPAAPDGLARLASGAYADARS
jgi:beta-lactamase class A